MNLLKRIKQYYTKIKVFDKTYSKEYDNDKPMEWNIYDTGLSYGEHLKKFRFIHYVLKYKLFVPFLLIFDRYLNKKLDHKEKQDWWSKELSLLNEAIKEGTELWHLQYMRYIGYYEGKKIQSFKARLKNYGSSLTLRLINTMVKLFNIFLGHDSAYHSLFKKVAHIFCSKMVKFYGKKPNYVLLYNSKNTHNFNFCILSSFLSDNHQVKIYQIDGRGKKELVKFDILKLLTGKYNLVEVEK